MKIKYHAGHSVALGGEVYLWYEAAPGWTECELDVYCKTRFGENAYSWNVIIPRHIDNMYDVLKELEQPAYQTVGTTQTFKYGPEFIIENLLARLKDEHNVACELTQNFMIQIEKPESGYYMLSYNHHGHKEYLLCEYDVHGEQVSGHDEMETRDEEEMVDHIKQLFPKNYPLDMPTPDNIIEIAKISVFLEELDRNVDNLQDELLHNGYNERYDLIMIVNDSVLRLPMNADTYSRLESFLRSEIEELKN